MLVRAGLKHGVSPSLISTRLLSEVDKADMRNGLIEQQALNEHVEVWKLAHMPEYSKGHIKPYIQFEDVTRISPINIMGIVQPAKDLRGRI
jgi:hypothetical protein